MKAMVIKEANGDFILEDRPVPEPGAGQVRIQVEACGICHSDAFAKSGAYPGLQLTRVPGLEVAGKVHKLGEGVDNFAVGDSVGVGWHGGHCHKCNACRRGLFINCENGQVCGISYDGGYAEYMVAPWEAAARIPDQISSVDAGPLLCAGITTFNALRNSGARPGDTLGRVEPGAQVLELEEREAGPARVGPGARFAARSSHTFIFGSRASRIASPTRL